MRHAHFILRDLLPPIATRFLRRVIHRTRFSPCKSPGVASDRDILYLARSHYFKAKERALPVTDSGRWRAFREQMASAIPSFGIPQDAIDYAQERVEFDHRLAADVSSHLFGLHQNTLEIDNPGFRSWFSDVTDCEYLDPATMLRESGRLVSNVLFWHMHNVARPLGFMSPSHPETVCEIGGGYGAPARVWQQAPHPPSKYIVIDLPESLFFAECFLRSACPQVPLGYVSAPDPMKPDNGFTLCPIQCVESLGKARIDLVVNTGSMQEMPENWVDFWMEWLDRQDCRYFYSLNYFSQPLNDMAEGENGFAPRLSSQWSTRVARFNPAFVRQQTSRNYAEIFSEKSAQAGRDLRDGQNLLDAIDAVRISGDKRPLLEKVMSLTVVPKEVGYLHE